MSEEKESKTGKVVGYFLQGLFNLYIPVVIISIIWAIVRGITK